MLNDLRNDSMLDRLQRAAQLAKSRKPKWPEGNLVGKDAQAVPFHPAQQLLWDSKRRIVVFAAGSQVGKCGRFLVQLADGRRKFVKDVVVGDEVLSLGDDLKITRNHVTASFATGVQDTYVVQTKSGREIIVTREHPLFGDTGWRPTGEFQIGDFIAVPRRYPELGRDSFDKKKLRLLGYLIGDGGLTTKSMTFTNTDEGILDDFRKCLPPECHLTYQSGTSYRIVGTGWGHTCNNPVMRWMEELELRWKYSGEKRIPDFVFTLANEYIAEVLSGLFDTDGCIHKLGIQYVSTSEKLVDDIQHLLLRFGIITTKRYIPLSENEKWGVSDKWDLRTSDTSGILSFSRNIHLHGVKASRLEKLVSERSGIEKNNQDRVPLFPVNDCIDATKEGVPSGKIRQVVDRDGYELTRLCRGRNVTRHYAKLLSEHFNIGAELAQSDIYWDTVKSIEYVGEQEVFDITVDRGHNFVANDIFAHNTSWTPWWMHREIGIKGTGDYLVVTSSFDLLKLKLLPAFLQTFEHILQIGRFWAGDKVLELADPETGKFWAEKSTDNMWGRIILRSAQALGGLESATAKAAVLDEAGQDEFPIDAYRAIRRRLTLNQGRLLITTTLYSINWLVSEIIKPAMANGETKTLTLPNGAEIDVTDSEKFDTTVVQADSTANPEFPKAEYEEARATLPDDVFQMFYRGRVTRPRHMIYDIYDEEYHLCPSFKIPDEWPRYLGLDFGGANTHAVFIAIDPGSGRLYVYREYHAGKRSAGEHVEELMFGEPGRPICYGGAIAEGQWRSEFREAGLPVREPKILDVWLGIQRVYSILKEGIPTSEKPIPEGQVRIQIFDNLDNLRMELNSYSRRTDSQGNPIADEISGKSTYHGADSLRSVLSSIPLNHRTLIATV